VDAAVALSFAANAVRLQLHTLDSNLGNFMRTLAMPTAAEPWSLTSLREKLIKIDARVVSHNRHGTFQIAEVAVPQQMFPTAGTAGTNMRRSEVTRASDERGRCVSMMAPHQCAARIKANLSPSASQLHRSCRSPLPTKPGQRVLSQVSPRSGGCRLSSRRSRQIWARLWRAAGIATVVVSSAAILASGEQAAAGSPDGTYYSESDDGGKGAQVQGLPRPNSTAGEAPPYDWIDWNGPNFFGPCQGDCSVSLLGGRQITTAMTRIMLIHNPVPPSEWHQGDAGIVAGAFSRRLMTFWNALNIEPQIGIAKRVGDMQAVERRQAREDLRELAIVEAQVALEQGGKQRAIIGGNGEVAGLIELSRRKAGPIAINAAAAHASAKHPYDVAMAVISATVAVLVNRAAELGTR
jgi:hypothetical protein